MARVKITRIICGMVRASSILPRSIEPALERARRVMPVVVVVGARQTGKSTLVRNASELATHAYVSLDDLSIRDRAQNAPEVLVRQSERMTIDEVQREPDLLLAVKQVVDDARKPGRFVLTGSANLLLMSTISESLAGRAAYLTLWPMTRREQMGLGRAGCWSDLVEHPPAHWIDALEASPRSSDTWQAAVRRGGYPPSALDLESPEDRGVWLEGYTMTYLERDLQALARIDQLAAFRRLMRAVALRVGSLQNQADLARDLGMPPTTAQRYLDLLETSFQLIRVPAFFANRTKRLVKAPKLYMSDTGIALHLSGESEPRGAHLENLVLCDLLVWKSGRTDRTEILHYRTTKGAEVDFVVETTSGVLPIEVKAAETVRTRDARHLESFLDEYSDMAQAGLLLYAGDRTFWMSKRVLAAPWCRAL